MNTGRTTMAKFDGEDLYKKQQEEALKVLNEVEKDQREEKKKSADKKQ